MEKFFEALGVDVIFDPTTPLSASEPPVPAVDTRTVELKKGYVHVEGALALTCDITFEQDVAIPLRDGTILYGDVLPIRKMCPSFWPIRPIANAAAGGT